MRAGALLIAERLCRPPLLVGPLEYVVDVLGAVHWPLFDALQNDALLGVLEQPGNTV